MRSSSSCGSENFAIIPLLCPYSTSSCVRYNECIQTGKPGQALQALIKIGAERASQLSEGFWIATRNATSQISLPKQELDVIQSHLDKHRKALADKTRRSDSSCDSTSAKDARIANFQFEHGHYQSEDTGIDFMFTKKQVDVVDSARPDADKDQSGSNNSREYWASRKQRASNTGNSNTLHGSSNSNSNSDNNRREKERDKDRHRDRDRDRDRDRGRTQLEEKTQRWRMERKEKYPGRTQSRNGDSESSHRRCKGTEDARNYPHNRIPSLDFPGGEEGAELSDRDESSELSPTGDFGDDFISL